MVNITLKYHIDTISIEVTQDSFFCQLIDDPVCKEIDFTDMKLSVSVRDFFCYFQQKEYDLYNLINCMNFFQMLDKYTSLFDKLVEPYDDRCYNNDISGLIMKHFGEYETLLKITQGLRLRYVGIMDCRNWKITDRLLYQCKDCLEITELNACNNPNITTVSHMTSLVTLNAYGRICGITDNGLKNVTWLQKLNTSNNKRIRTVNHMKSLIKLDARYGCGINNGGLKNVTTLQELDVHFNPNITTVNHMPSLIKLYAGYKCGISDKGLKNVTSLQVLDASGNEKITTVNHMPSLVELGARDNCGINDEGLKNVTSLQVLDASGNSKITTVNHMTSLVKLGALNDYDIFDVGLRNCMLIKLDPCRNPKITKITKR